MLFSFIKALPFAGNGTTDSGQYLRSYCVILLLCICSYVCSVEIKLYVANVKSIFRKWLVQPVIINDA